MCDCVDCEDKREELACELTDTQAMLQEAQEEVEAARYGEPVVNVCSWCFNEFRGAYGAHYCSSVCEEGRGPKGSWELYWHRLHPGTKEPRVWQETFA